MAVTFAARGDLMIAKFGYLLPYALWLPEGEEYTTYQYEDSGYLVHVQLPMHHNQPAKEQDPDEVLLDGKKAFQASVIVIEFQKESFDRRQLTEPQKPGESALRDPPPALVKRALDSLITRIRYAARSHLMQPVDFPHGQWKIQYLNDDGSELQREEGFLRACGSVRLEVRVTALTPSVWNDANLLPIDFEVPAWEELLLDAVGESRKVGVAVTLAASALEVFISVMLSKLIEMRSADDLELYKWIDDRGNYWKEPSVLEQYDQLLKWAVGHSLKEVPDLWSAFQNLKSARNSFAHEGVATIGKGKKEVDGPMALGLVNDARKIIQQVRAWLPSELHWKQCSSSTRMEIKKVLLKPAGGGGAPAAPAGEGGTIEE